MTEEEKIQVHLPLHNLEGVVLFQKQIDQLHGEYEKLANWRLCKDIADKYYGPKAVKMELNFLGEYNDEGGTNYTVTDFTVYDADGNILELDLMAPWCDEYVAEYDEESREALKTYRNDPDVFWENADDDETTIVEEWIICNEEFPDNSEVWEYDLTKEPQITWPVVVAPRPAEKMPVAISNEEVKELAAKIVEIEEWTIMHDLVRKYYGKNAAKVIVTTEDGYNDEAEPVTEIDDFVILDADGNEAVPEGEISQDEAYSCVRWEDEDSEKIPVKSWTYDLTTKPALPYTTIMGIHA